MLVVQEKRGRFHGIGVWKLPTGVVDAVCSFSKTNFIPPSKTNDNIIIIITICLEIHNLVLAPAG